MGLILTEKKDLYWYPYSEFLVIFSKKEVKEDEKAFKQNGIETWGIPLEQS